MNDIDKKKIERLENLIFELFKEPPPNKIIKGRTEARHVNVLEERLQFIYGEINRILKTRESKKIIELQKRVIELQDEIIRLKKDK